jgi:hypothetical protein
LALLWEVGKAKAARPQGEYRGISRGLNPDETRDWTELDADGESKVKVRLAMSYYADVGARRALVLEWLRPKVKNKTVDVRAAATAAAAERHARVAALRTKEAKRAKKDHYRADFCLAGGAGGGRGGKTTAGRMGKER